MFRYSCLIVAVLTLSSSTQVSSSSSNLEFQLQYQVFENQPAGHFIGDLNSDAFSQWERRQTGEETPALFTGSHLYRFSQENDLFSLNEATSSLLLAQSPDLESLCTSPTDCASSDGFKVALQVNAFSAGVASKDSEQQSSDRIVGTFQIQIRILDVNDNPPQFPDGPNVTIRPREIIFHKYRTIDLPRAMDRDISAENSRIEYELEKPHSATFQLQTTADGQPQLRLLEDLDYERESGYHFALLAKNPTPVIMPQQNTSAFLPQVARLIVNIQVLDENDNEPVFNQSEYIVSVPENIPPGTVIYKLHATDRDVSSVLTYQLLSEDNTPLRGAFFRVKENGEVLVKKALDYESRSEFNLLVQVSDGEFHSTSRLVVRLTDVRDEQPEYHVNPQRLTLEEEREGNTLIGQVTVVDRDSSEVNGQVRCFEPPPRVVNPGEETAVSLQQPIRFAPMTMTSKDSQNRMSLKFDLFSRDKYDRENITAKVSPEYLRIIQDKSTNKTSAVYLLSSLICHDGGGPEDSINAQTISTIPISTPSSISSVPLMVSNSGVAPRLTSTLTLSVLLEDVNDQSPVFNPQHLVGRVMENSPVGTKVLQVKATDADAGMNAQIRYELEGKSNYFFVDPQTGWISTIVGLDREVKDEYQVNVIATDRGHIPRTGTAVVDILIEDDNDHAPQLLPPKQFTVRENLPGNTWIGQLRARDMDQSHRDNPNAQVTFSFMPSGMIVKNNSTTTNSTLIFAEKAESGPFILESNGVLKTRISLDREKKSRYCPTIILQNSAKANRPQHSTDMICIQVEDVNDNSPQFNLVHLKANGAVKNISTQSNATTVSMRLSLYEPANHLVLKATARDKDIGQNGEVRYILHQHQMKQKQQALQVNERNSSPTLTPSATDDMEPPFYVNAHTGEIRLNRVLAPDRDADRHVLRLVAADQGAVPLSTTLTIHIDVEDVDPVSDRETGQQQPPHRSKSSQHRETRLLSSLGLGHNVFVVVIMSVVSAFLILVLAAAIFCVVKPCPSKKRPSAPSCDTPADPLYPQPGMCMYPLASAGFYGSAPRHHLTLGPGSSSRYPYATPVTSTNAVPSYWSSPTTEGFLAHQQAQIDHQQHSAAYSAAKSPLQHEVYVSEAVLSRPESRLLEGDQSTQPEENVAMRDYWSMGPMGSCLDASADFGGSINIMDNNNVPEHQAMPVPAFLNLFSTNNSVLKPTCNRSDSGKGDSEENMRRRVLEEESQALQCAKGMNISKVQSAPTPPPRLAMSPQASIQ